MRLSKPKFDLIIEGLRNNQLTELDLSYRYFTSNQFDQIIEAIAANTSLVNIQFDQIEIGDDQGGIGGEYAKRIAAALANKSNLQTLILNRNSIGNDGAKALADVLKDKKSLTKLGLKGNKISDDAVGDICAVLENDGIKLDLADNQITDAGAATIAQVLENKTNKLAELSLSDNQLTNYGARLIDDALKTEKAIFDKMNYGEKCDWFAKLVIDGIKDKYPYIKTNPDGSISFIFASDEETDVRRHIFPNRDFKNISEESFRTIYFPFIEDLFKKYVDKKIDPAQDICTLEESGKKGAATEGVFECRFNISPETMDLVLKTMVTRHNIYAYREENSILKILNKKFEMKDGKIRLFPVLKVGDDYCLRGSGCQVTEMAGVQLLRLLPAKDDTAKGGFEVFHRWPGRIEDLGFSNHNYMVVLNEILKRQGVCSDRLHEDNMKGSSIITEPQNESPLQIVDMDTESRHFYAIYGNTDVGELKYSQSLEVDRDYFFEVAREVMKGSDKALKFFDLVEKKELSPSPTSASVMPLVSNGKDRSQ